ncbi:hypothetical protein PF010_g11206 [Phytophthora fragariae]|uniref:Uncharacterized protein n=1 Tax=Phytophthora fragariae TaxID=53985 RepID=A0A6G0L7A7_9STRA|nr:hypothetical protein PF003_g30355 [Phytophthora fragariae]KAE9110327.1 hypothetical protein PF010_g11206 [Phytophthora fragariae]
MGRWLTIENKRELIDKSAAEPGMTHSELARWSKRAFRLRKAPARNTVSDILKNASTIKKPEYGEGKRRKPLKVKAPALEKNSEEWVGSVEARGLCLNRKAITRKAEQIREDVGGPALGVGLSVAGDRAGRDESPVRAYARAGVLDPESSYEVADQDADAVMEVSPVTEQQAAVTTMPRDADMQPESVTAQPAAPVHVPDEADEEPRIYVFAGQGRRGVDSLVSPQPRLARLQPQEKVIEVRRRRYQTRTGRYVLEFEEKRANPDGRPETIWINQKDYEQLWVDGRLRLGDDDRGADEQQDEGEQDGSQRRSPLATQRESRTIRC